MGWKSIDMQMALNRVPEAGKLQEQLMKENQHFQESLSQSKLKQDEEIRKRVNTYEDVEKGTIQDEENNNQQRERDKGGSSAENKQDETAAAHPFLGNKIDYSG